METKQSNGGKICLYCFLVVAAILGIIAFIFSLTKKCGEGFRQKCWNDHKWEEVALPGGEIIQMYSGFERKCTDEGSKKKKIVGYTAQYKGADCSDSQGCSSGSQAGPGCADGGKHCGIPYGISECQGDEKDLPAQNACKTAAPWPGWTTPCKNGDMYYTGQWTDCCPLDPTVTPWVVYSPDPGQLQALGDGECQD